ncbi:putative reverse transcriptase domain-containing protein [Tanacetum coccineum]
MVVFRHLHWYGLDNWLSKYHAKILSDEKVVHIPIDDETLIIRGAAPVARAPYRLAPSEMQEQSNQLKRVRHTAKKVLMVYILPSRGIQVDPAKIKAVKNWASPTNPQKDLIMHESHKSKCSIHPGSDKLYQNLKKLYWWPNMKAIIVEYVGKCLTCSRVKAKYQKPSGLLIQPDIPTRKWERITMDFITKLPKTSNKHDTIWSHVDRLTKSAHFIPTRETDSMETLTRLYIKEIVSRHGVPISIISNRDNHFTSRFWQSMQNALDFGKGWERHLPLCRSPFCWAEVGDVQLTRPEIIHETTEKIVQIRQHLQAARDQQKSYANIRRKLLEFQVEDRVMLKVSPWKGVIRFGKRGKLNPRYIRPFKILKRVNPVAYTLELPKEPSTVHSTFFVSNLKKCLSDESLVILIKELRLDDKLDFMEEPIEIMDREVKKLKQSRIPIVKVRWRTLKEDQKFLGMQDHIRAKNPHLIYQTSLQTSNLNLETRFVKGQETITTA